jgi:fatty-acyl-CoA synthase
VVDAGTAYSYLHDTVTLGELFVRAAMRFGDDVALRDDSSTLTYKEMGACMRAYAAAFVSLGLERGKAFSILSANRNDAVVAIAAGLMLGLRYTPLHPKASVEDHAFILGDADVDLLIVDERYFEAHCRALLPQCPGMRAIAFDGFDGVEGLNAMAKKLSPLPLESLARANDPAFLIYTGGTTGRSKGILHRNRSLVTNLLLQMSDCELPQKMRFLAVTPISHAAFLFILPTLLRGGELVMRAKFDPAKFVSDLHFHGITATFLVPTMIYVLIDRTEIWEKGPGALETLVYGASPISASRLAKAMEAFGPIFVQVYGQVECPNIISVLNKADHAYQPLLSSCGFPTPGVTVALLDDGLNAVPAGEVGEICVRGPLVMEEYWKRADANTEALRGGWLHTGDMGRFDKHGYLYIEDRKKDLIISGGFNIFPREVEEVLNRHPEVKIAAVIAMPDDKWGEAVLAVVVPRRAEFADAKLLIDLVRETKGAVSAPKRIEFVSELPLTGLGKPDKKLLRTRYWAGATRGVN